MGKKARLSESDSRISQFAKLFGVMHEPFVPPSTLLIAHPDMSSTYHGRYESELSKVQGITADLYDVHAFRSEIECHSLIFYNMVLIIFSSLLHS